MQIETIKPHQNTYGEKYEKNAGDVYEHPAPRGLIKIGIAKNANQNDGKGKRLSRDGESTISAKKHDGEISRKASSKASPRAGKARRNK